MSKILEQFTDFLHSEETTMFITGGPGTGKTTALLEIFNYLRVFNVHPKIDFLFCAFTNKAVNVLIERGIHPEYASTLHKYLVKVPGTNQYATSLKEIDINLKLKENSEYKDIIIIDEYSMLERSDAEDLINLTKLGTKLVIVGDPNQLPPVKGKITIVPSDKTRVMELTKVWRQENSPDLKKVIDKILSFMKGATLEPLESNYCFKRNVDLIEAYKYYKVQGKKIKLLAYTNKQVEYYNNKIQGSNLFYPEDRLFCLTNSSNCTFKGYRIDFNVPVSGYNKMLRNYEVKLLDKMGASLVCLLHENALFESNHMIIKGLTLYNEILNKLNKKAIEQTRIIKNLIKKTRKDLNPDKDIKVFLNTQLHSKEVKKYKKAWYKVNLFKSNVLVLDFDHAITVHKSQGSTYDIVMVDTEDLGACAERNMDLYLRLSYVAFSRAREEVFINSV